MRGAVAVLRGAAAAGTAGFLIFAGLVIVGVTELRSPNLILAGAVLAAVVGLYRPDGRWLGIVGALVVGGLTVVSGLVSGFGLLEYSTVAGSALAAVWFGVGERTPRNFKSWFRWGGVMAVVLVAVLLPLILSGGTLGHDESAYALKARQLLEGTPETGWGFHRGIGMSLYGYAVLGMGGSEAGLRLLGLIGAVALSAGAWALGRRMVDAETGAIASVAVVTGPSLLARSTEYLSDVPSAALLTFTMVVLWRELHDRDQPTYRLLWALPVAWAAFYLRYQAALSLALIALVAMVLWWPKIRRRPGPVLWLVVVGLLGLIPYFLLSVDLTGHPLGIFTGTRRILGAAVGEGFGDYATQFGQALGGWVAPIALASALVGVVKWWRDRGTRNRYLFLLVPALLQVVVLGLFAHGESRFLFFPLTVTVVAGATTVRRWVSQGRRPWANAANALALGLAIVVIGTLGVSSSAARRWVEIRRASNEPVELAAREVATRSGGVSCGVMTSYDSQVTYYSGCLTDIFRTNLRPADALARIPGEDKFLVLIENGKRQPTGDELDVLLALTDGSPVVVSGERRSGTIYRFEE
jgi:hypothetical protein